MGERIHKAKGLEKDFLILRNEDVQRIDLSYEAIGLLTYLMSLPSDWVIYVSTLERKGTGRDKVRRMITELKEKGYLSVEQNHNTDGTFTTNEYHAYAMPEYNPNWQPLPEKAAAVNPLTENPQLQSKDNKKEKIKDIALDAPSDSKQKPYYDAIVEVLNIHGGRNVNIEKMLSGKAANNGYKQFNLNPPVSLEEFKLWGVWHKEKYAGVTMVQSPEKIQSSIMAYRAEKSKVVQKSELVTPSQSVSASQAMSNLLGEL